LREPGVYAGAFDDVVNGHHTHVVELGDCWDEEALRAAMAQWIFEVSGGGSLLSTVARRLRVVANCCATARRREMAEVIVIAPQHLRRPRSSLIHC
jgi:hypothetical protein